MKFKDEEINAGNQEVIQRIQTSKINLCGVERAGEAIDFLQKFSFLHSGPPVQWKNMCSAMRSAVCGAAVYEGWAENLKTAQDMADQGCFTFGSNNEHSAVGPMAGIISPSMPVMIFKNTTFGNQAYVTFNEGLGKTLRFGANDASVINRLKWIEKTLGPIIKDALELSGPIDITAMLAKGIQRGDECHNRNKASTGLFIRKIAPWMVRTAADREDVAEALAFMDGNDHFFLNLSMGNSKATMDATIGVKASTIVNCMCTNGHHFGIRVAGTGKTWFSGPSGYAEGNYFEGYNAADACTVMGDSYISEAAGIGAFAMGAAPGIGRFIGLKAPDTLQYSLKMYKITLAEHKAFKIPALDFQGTPLGIDIRKVISTGILPIINTGIAHKKPGIGQIGAGVVYPPMVCFEKAITEMGLNEILSINAGSKINLK